MVNKNNGNFEIEFHLTSSENPLYSFQTKRNLVSSLLILNKKKCMQIIIEIVRAACEIFPKCGDWQGFRIFRRGTAHRKKQYKLT